MAKLRACRSAGRLLVSAGFQEVRIVSATARLHAWRRVALGLVGVAGVLICLFAMSQSAVITVSGSAGVALAAPQTATFAGQLPPAVDPGATAPSSERCGATCLPAHEVVAATCVLVWMAAVALLAIDLTVTRWNSIRGFFVALVAQAAALAPPSPPSLHVLSISRT